MTSNILCPVSNSTFGEPSTARTLNNGRCCTLRKIPPEIRLVVFRLALNEDYMRNMGIFNALRGDIIIYGEAIEAFDDKRMVRTVPGHPFFVPNTISNHHVSRIRNLHISLAFLTNEVPTGLTSLHTLKVDFSTTRLSMGGPSYVSDTLLHIGIKWTNISSLREITAIFLDHVPTGSFRSLRGTQGAASAVVLLNHGLCLPAIQSFTLDPSGRHLLMMYTWKASKRTTFKWIWNGDNEWLKDKEDVTRNRAIRASKGEMRFGNL